jgi:hypothetical protein
MLSLLVSKKSSIESSSASVLVKVPEILV